MAANIGELSSLRGTSICKFSNSILEYYKFLLIIFNIKLYLERDDDLIYRKINSINDTNQLQHDLEKLLEWEFHLSMESNPDKCKVLRITNKRKIITNNYIMCGEMLELVDSAKYLGVFFHKMLS